MRKVVLIPLAVCVLALVAWRVMSLGGDPRTRAEQL